MSKFIDLTGQKFNMLVVLKRVEDKISPSGQKYVQWLCKCECGNECIVQSTNLKTGHTTSCGCLQKQRISETHLDNLTGERFGRLVVLRRTEDMVSPSGSKDVTWECQCDCGNFTEIYTEALKTGHTRSCGCQNSIGEYSILRYLNKNNIAYEYQKRFNDCCGIGNKPLSYDFYLPIHNILIEYQGQQHYYPVDIYGGEEHFEIQQEHDRRKREYATANGYNLIEIPYYDYDNIDEILDKVLSTSKVGNS